jgi:large subunit ribosomal protein L6
MSRVGTAPIHIPENVTVEVDGKQVQVTGPKGALTREVHPSVAVSVAGSEVVAEPKGTSRAERALWGTFASHIRNMIHGVTEGYEKRLVVEGVGYRAEQQGNALVMHVGFSHPVSVEIPEGITVSIEKEVVSISGIDKERVGQFAASVRAIKKPEPYKGKGIRYEDEVVRRKEGKKA